MLGSMLAEHFKKVPEVELKTAARTLFGAEQADYEFDVELFLKHPENFKWIRDFDYILNAIGIIKPYCRDNDPEGCARAMRINGEFPRVMAKALQGAKTKVIQIATDCVYDGADGGYSESSPHNATDVYGKSKSLGEVVDPHFLHIRSSIIGPEHKSKLSLLEWFLSQPKNSEVQGYDHHLWNGVTTLQFAELCEKIILSGAFESLRAKSAVHHFVPNESVSKYQLLQMMSEVFNHPVKLVRINRDTDAIDRTLSTNFHELEKIFPRSDLKTELKRIKK